jgi:lipoate-protein ligase A
VTELSSLVSPPGPNVWRLLDDLNRARSADEQMAADLQLLDEVATGATPALRLYTWTRPTLSIGRFQDLSDIDVAACTRAGVPVVRRPTGGAALLHGADLTYAVVMPLRDGFDTGVQAVYDLIARGLITGLEGLGVHAAVARNDGPPGAVCFAGQQGADLRVADRKVCGSAQVRKRGAVLQHGSILLRRLPIDETDLVRGGGDKAALRRATVTLEELAAPTQPARVGAALKAGFELALDLVFARATLAAPGNTNIVGISSSASVAL